MKKRRLYVAHDDFGLTISRQKSVWCRELDFYSNDGDFSIVSNSHADLLNIPRPGQGEQWLIVWSDGWTNERQWSGGWTVERRWMKGRVQR